MISAECLHAHRDPDIADAAYDSDLAAVRGHLRRDRRCLDQLFDGQAALHRAAYDRTGAIVAFLLAQGAAVDVVDGYSGPELRRRRWEPPGGAWDVGGRGWTPLHVAALHGLTENARLLLAAKASADSKDEHGRGPQPTSQPCWKKMAFTGKRIE